MEKKVNALAELGGHRQVPLCAWEKWVHGGQMILEKLQAREQKLTEQINLLEKRLLSFPEGKLVCCHQGKRVKWYISMDGQKTYLPKENVDLAHSLAEKEYLLSKLNDDKAELKALQTVIGQDIKPNTAATLLNIPGYKALLPEYTQYTDSSLDEWVNAPYKHLESHPEGLIHKTISGRKVRSKSEEKIANCLLSNHIPFRYEEELIIGDVVLHPDFTTRHPYDGRIIYWEHLGMMDISAYRDTATKKLRIYSDAGIYPMINLIITSETKEMPLDYNIVEGIIQTYFF